MSKKESVLYNILLDIKTSIWPKLKGILIILGVLIFCFAPLSKYEIEDEKKIVLKNSITQTYWILEYKLDENNAYKIEKKTKGKYTKVVQGDESSFVVIDIFIEYNEKNFKLLFNKEGRFSGFSCLKSCWFNIDLKV